MKVKIIAVLGLLLCCTLSVWAESGGKQLIVCFPSSREISITGEVDAVTYASGNTLSLARLVQEYTGADVFEIELVRPYSASYNTVLSEAKEDQKNRARPEIRNRVGNMREYDTVFIGFPNWWASIPMPVAAFLESYDFSGKRIVPFCTHGGGRFGQSLSAIGKIVPSAIIMEPFRIKYGGGSSLERDVVKWLQENGVAVK